MKKICFMALFLCSFAVLADLDAYQKGLHYTEINPVHETGHDDKVIVYEFFSYKCGHCANFEPHMVNLEKNLPRYAKVIRVPLGIQSSWKAFAKAYYTAEQMGILEKSHQAIFDALHKQKKRLGSIEDIAQWFSTEHNVDKEKFLSIANSFMVDNMIKKGNNMAQKMLGIPRTPSLVIDGRYKPDINKLGSFSAAIELTKQLIETEAEQRNLSQSK